MPEHARQIPRSRTGAEQPGNARGPIPRFLIIGAMKAGTTTLYRDLLEHPGIHMPLQKEPETLVRSLHSILRFSLTSPTFFPYFSSLSFSFLPSP